LVSTRFIASDPSSGVHFILFEC